MVRFPHTTTMGRTNMDHDEDEDEEEHEDEHEEEDGDEYNKGDEKDKNAIPEHFSVTNRRIFHDKAKSHLVFHALFVEKNLQSGSGRPHCQPNNEIEF